MLVFFFGCRRLRVHVSLTSLTFKANFFREIEVLDSHVFALEELLKKLEAEANHDLSEDRS